MACVISISNHKGGVSKTTSVLNVGAGLSMLGKRVLLIDMDSQANLSIRLHMKNADGGLSDIIYGTMHPVEVICRTAIGVDLIPTSIDQQALEMVFSEEEGDKNAILKKAMSQVKKDYDYILIDTPPIMDLFTRNAYAFSDFVLVPLLPEEESIEGLENVEKIIRKNRMRLNEDLFLGGLFITQFFEDERLDESIRDRLEKKYGDKLLRTVVHFDKAQRNATSSRKDIFSYDKSSRAAFDYSNLIKEIQLIGAPSLV